MAHSQQVKSYTRKRIADISAVIVAGLCWYFGNGLNGDFWYLLWFAPVPIILLSLRNNASMTFVIAFVAYLIGRLSWFSYLETVATVVPAILFTLLLPLIFASIILLARIIILKTSAWYSVFVFPVFFTLFESLLITFSPDGTAASIAYSQADFLPLVQIISVTGLLGITFIITLIPSTIALGWYYRKRTTTVMTIAVAPLVVVASVFLFGTIRLNHPAKAPAFKIGLALLNEKFHNMSAHPDFHKEELVAEYYSKEIESLAAKGAQLVVLPERAINLDKDSYDSTTEIFLNTAKRHHVFIVAGYTNYREEKQKNSALIISPEGVVVTSYNKVHMVTGLEDQFVPGREPIVVSMLGYNAGVAICKDLDFPGYIRKYGEQRPAFICVPAWDFIVDDWLHSRMAIMRGVENGFSVARTARQGRLTISDAYGRVPFESNAALGQEISLVGDLLTLQMNTVYGRLGDWFGFLNAAAALFFIVLTFRKTRL